MSSFSNNLPSRFLERHFRRSQKGRKLVEIRKPESFLLKMKSSLLHILFTILPLAGSNGREVLKIEEEKMCLSSRLFR